jgi:hypothetical protein
MIGEAAAIILDILIVRRTSLSLCLFLPFCHVRMTLLLLCQELRIGQWRAANPTPAKKSLE